MVLNSRLENSGLNPHPLSEIFSENSLTFKVLSYFKTVMGGSYHLPHRPTQILSCKSDSATALPKTFGAPPVCKLSEISCSWHSRPCTPVLGPSPATSAVASIDGVNLGSRVMLDTGTIQVSEMRCQSGWWDS